MGARYLHILPVLFLVVFGVIFSKFVGFHDLVLLKSLQFSWERWKDRTVGIVFYEAFLCDRTVWFGGSPGVIVVQLITKK